MIIVPVPLPIAACPHGDHVILLCNRDRCRRDVFLFPGFIPNVQTAMGINCNSNVLCAGGYFDTPEIDVDNHFASRRAGEVLPNNFFAGAHCGYGGGEEYENEVRKT